MDGSGDGARAAAALAPGSQMRVHGLSGATEHNGKQCVVRAYHANRDRYAVSLGGLSILVKRCNLQEMGT